MDIRLFEKLRLLEAPAVAEPKVAVDPQKEMKRYYKGRSTKLTKSTWPSEREEQQYKFWLLWDGTVIPVPHSHNKTLHDASLFDYSWLSFAGTGAVGGYFSLDADEMGVTSGKKLTSKQVSKLKNLYLDYKVSTLYMDVPRMDFESPIKSVSHLDYLLTYGKDVDEAKSEEEQKGQFFIERTEKHIKLVQEAAAKIVEAYPEFDELLKQVEVHDASKLEEPERTPYVEITWRHKLENEKGEYDPYNGKGYQTPGKLEKEDENQATLHHITTNSHHPEYHLEDKSDANINKDARDKSDKCIDASRMPDTDVAEMVADWQAMAEELQTNTTREWFDKQKDVRWHFSEHQEELIDRLLKVFEEE